MHDRHVDVVDLGEGRYVFVSENRLTFLSGVNGDELPKLLCDETRAGARKDEQDAKQSQLGPSIAFMTTLDCNLRCTYCYSRGGDDKIQLRPDVARTAIDNIVRETANPEETVLAIYFVGGGEPLLQFELVRDVCAYARQKFGGVDIILVTNGTFGRRQREWLIENRVATRVSYDAGAQGEQRPAVSGKNLAHVVEENIRELIRGGVSLTVQLTITTANVGQMAESVKRIAELGVKYVKIEPTHDSPLSRGDANLVPDIQTFTKNFLDTIRLILREGLHIKIDNSFMSRPTSGYYCGTGDGSNKTVTPFGAITSCLEVVRPTDAFADKMIVGRTTESGFEIDQTRRAFLDRLHWRNYPDCPSCNLKLICGGGCPMQGGWDNNDLLTPSAYNCRMHKTLVPKIFEMVFEDNRVVNIICDNHTASGTC